MNSNVGGTQERLRATLACARLAWSKNQHFIPPTAPAKLVPKALVIVKHFTEEVVEETKVALYTQHTALIPKGSFSVCFPFKAAPQLWPL